jgi:hypothetical protein
MQVKEDIIFQSKKKKKIQFRHKSGPKWVESIGYY